MDSLSPTFLDSSLPPPSLPSTYIHSPLAILRPFRPPLYASSCPHPRDSPPDHLCHQVTNARPHLSTFPFASQTGPLEGPPQASRSTADHDAMISEKKSSDEATRPRMPPPLSAPLPLLLCTLSLTLLLPFPSLSLCLSSSHRLLVPCGSGDMLVTCLQTRQPLPLPSYTLLPYFLLPLSVLTTPSPSLPPFPSCTLSLLTYMRIILVLVVVVLLLLLFLCCCRS